MKHVQRCARLTCAALLALITWMHIHAAGGAEPPRVDLTITLDPATRAFHATAELTAPRDFRFALHEALTVSAASVNGKPVAATADATRHGAREWHVPAPEGALLQIQYGGTLPALDASLDHRAVLGVSVPMASPQGSFLQSGSRWYPSPDRLFTYVVHITVPGEQRALVAGHLTREVMPSNTEPRYSATFEFAQPTDGIDLIAGPYAIREQTLARAGQEPVRLRTYFTRDLAALADDYLADTRRYIELYSEQIGAYPYREFSIVASPLPTGFGMPTLTYLGAQVLKLPFIRAASLGHEVLHNWWGNGVYPDYAKGNWSEGLTTFMADYAYKELTSADAAREMRLTWLRDFAAIPDGVQQPLSAFRSRTHGAEAAVGYGKAAMMFFMLRDAIGAEPFQRGIRSFWKQHRFTIASWDDLERAFEGASGRPLKTFFDQWIERAGGPRLDIESATARDGDRLLALTVSQSAPAYALRVPVALRKAERTETRWLDVDRERQTVTLPVDALPDSVQLDPELRLWRVLEAAELPPILRRWIIARAPRLVIASTEKDVQTAALTLARAFFETSPRIESRLPLTGNEPVLLIGLERDVDRMLAQLGIRSRPSVVAQRGTAQVWTVQNNSAPALAVISVRDAATLSSLQRPLPHYGSQSYLIFEGSKVIDRGVWPVSARSVPVTRR